MAVAPYRITDRRSSTGYVNTLYEAANTNLQRKTPSDLSRDSWRTVTPTGRRQLISFSRWLYSNFPSVHGMLLEQANLAVSSWVPQFWGEDVEWGNKAEEWLINWHNICDYRGWPYDFDTYVRMLVLSPLRCGDIATLLTEGAGGYPFIQVIPGHRIGSDTNSDKVSGGPYDGLRIIDGVIFDDFGRVVAYRVWQDYPYQAMAYGRPGSQFEDISADSLFLTFDPEWPDQVRGMPALASAANTLQDMAETHNNERIALKAASAIALLETNPEGEADSAKAVIKTAATFDSSNNKTANAYEEIAGGAIRYFRAGTGSKLEAFSHNRPGQAAQAFLDSCARDAFRGAEWDAFFSLDPKNAGGAPMRLIVEKLNNVIKRRQAVVAKTCRRVDSWAVAKAIKIGQLPASAEWWKWEYQGPREVTADRKYDSDVDLQEYNARFVTLKQITGRRGQYWEDVQDQWLVEQKRLQDRAKEMGVDLNNIAVQETTSEVISTKSQVTNDATGGGSQNQNTQDNSDQGAQ